MSYTVSARKWRPQTFGSLVGQNHISQTLQNALRNGRVPQAVLFTGPRGTGKTSSARILAKSLRCAQAVEFTPCNKCRDCEDISVGRSVDVLEIDGASNNGVESIRELRETVGYRPSSGHYKIYIIDEVHMLSTSAFNALLKTLEEPPEHVIFILATTEVNKIPLTILSRCQRFDFRRISTREIVQELHRICTAENWATETEALWAVARQGDGSMRDSLSILDQVLSFANGPLTSAVVMDVLGMAPSSLGFKALGALIQREVESVLQVLMQVRQGGYDPVLFLQNLLENLRNALILKTPSSLTESTLDLPDSEIRELKSWAEQTTEEDLHLLFDLGLKGSNDIVRALQPQVVFEMVLLRMAKAPQIRDLQALLKTGGGASVAARTLASPVSKGPLRPSQSTAPSGKPAASSALAPAEKWFQVVQNLRVEDPLLAAKIEPLLFGASAGK